MEWSEWERFEIQKWHGRILVLPCMRPYPHLIDIYHL